LGYVRSGRGVPRSIVRPKLTVWRNDVAAGAIAAIVGLPVCIASGLLAFAPLGPSYAVAGATAGLCGEIGSCCVSALVATSSFIVTTSRVSEALLLASLPAALLTVALRPSLPTNMSSPLSCCTAVIRSYSTVRAAGDRD